MLTTLIRRELLDNLMTFRFAAAVFIMLLLVVANTVVLIRDYERRLADYNTAVKTHQQQLLENKTYSVGFLYVDRPPNPLSLFNVGLDKRLGNTLEVYHGYVPTLWDATLHGSDNPFMNIFFSMDIAFIFEVVISLMALIFAYNALAGERERGTLRLILMHPVPRGHILFAKYISAMLCLLVPVLLSVLFAMILLTISPSFSFSMSDFLRIGGIVLASLVYLSVFYLIGMLISATIHRTSTALVFSMFVWGFLVLFYPNTIIAAVPHRSTDQARAASAFNEIRQIWEEFDRERLHLLTTDPVPGEAMEFHIEMKGPGFSFEYFDVDPSTLKYFYQAGVHFEDFASKPQPNVPHAQNYFRFLGPRVIDAAERTWLLRKPVLEDIYVQPAIVKKKLLKLSPIGLYDAATQSWAGTDHLGIQDFFAAVRQYQQTVIDYFFDQDTFGSRQWFSADQGAVDWSRLPQFSFQRSNVAINAKRALPAIGLLLIINIVLFAGIFLVFQRSDV